jgi:putative transposase
MRTRLWAFMGGVARERNAKALCIGGTDNHVHLLISIPATIHVAELVKAIKAISSIWVHEEYPEKRHFAWQKGYGAFSIGRAQREVTAAYIANQEEHHRKRSFEEEFVTFLERNGVEYDARFVFG